jgi:hypothetical protein
VNLTIDKQCILSGADPAIINKIKQVLTMKNPAYVEAKKRPLTRLPTHPKIKIL